MVDLIKDILFVLGVILFVIVLPVWGLLRLRRARIAKEKAQRKKQKEAFEQRQLNPDFALFKSKYGCELPPPLRALYGQHDWLRDENFRVKVPSGGKYYIAWIEPMDEQEWPDIDGYYSFANDGCGNAFLINPTDSDPEIFFLEHELGERESLGVRLSEFIVLKRMKN